jgi:branched-chain amino acid transport system ATP-binding protein
MREAIVQLEDFTLLREGVPLFEPLSLAIGAGQIVSILGQNGVGKTTLLSLIAGLHRQGIGHHGQCIVVSSTIMLKAVESARAGVMLIRQMSTNYRRLRVLDQVVLSALEPYSLWASLFSSVRKQRLNTFQIAMDALGEMGLDEEAATPVAQLSLGQRRALALASARVRLKAGRLRLLLLDEPMSGLDEPRRLTLSALLKDIAACGCAIMVAEHLGVSQTPLGETAITLNPYPGGRR